MRVHTLWHCDTPLVYVFYHNTSPPQHLALSQIPLTHLDDITAVGSVSCLTGSGLNPRYAAGTLISGELRLDHTGPLYVAQQIKMCAVLPLMSWSLAQHMTYIGYRRSFFALHMDSPGRLLQNVLCVTGSVHKLWKKTRLICPDFVMNTMNIIEMNGTLQFYSKN